MRLLDAPDEVLAALHPLRRKVLAELGQPDSASGLAKRLGLTRQKVNYHLRALEDLGLVELVEIRPVRGVTERVLARRHDVVLADPGVIDLPALSALDASDRRGLGAVVAGAVEVLRTAARLAAGAAEQRRRVASASVRADVSLPDPAALRALLDDLAEVVAHHDRPGHEGAMRFTLTAAVLPQPPTST